LLLKIVVVVEVGVLSETFQEKKLRAINTLKHDTGEPVLIIQGDKTGNWEDIAVFRKWDYWKQTK